MQVVRQVLPHVSDFRRFWKQTGPFEFALTSAEFPPVLLGPEEWIFGHTARDVLEALMGFAPGKTKIVRSDFNVKNTRILRPTHLIPWKIQDFPEEWNHVVCDFFVPEGHLTRAVADRMNAVSVPGDDVHQVAAAFFSLLENHLEAMGYVWLRPRENARYAAIQAYLSEWEKDEKDAGLI
ncbi:MAG: hypothetical protein K9K63_01310 [Desulfotignum sp.]|nr:hypothetical protein [Desulfotignum sp.]MCF8135929.1 hypothetical protein [Desulfotignum sp.]